MRSTSARSRSQAATSTTRRLRRTTASSSPPARGGRTRAVATNVGRALQSSFRAVEQANPDKLYGIFSDAQWTNKERLSDDTLRDLIEHFSTKTLSTANVPEDQFGQAYEYLIKRFADDSGHTAQEFYTNRTLVQLMTQILDPQPGESVYDPTCGTGGMLLSAAVELKRQGKEHRNLKLYGQELNLMSSSIARMNLFLHGIQDFRIERGNTLSEPRFLEGDQLQQFDVVLANPPYSIKQWDRALFAADPYGRNSLGTPPQGRADYAFLQHILASLKEGSGRCAVLFPHPRRGARDAQTPDRGRSHRLCARPRARPLLQQPDGGRHHHFACH